MRFRSLAAVLVLVAACGGNGDGPATTPQPIGGSPDGGSTSGGPGPGPGPGPTGDDGGTTPGSTGGSPVPYDQATQKSTHNSYEHFEPLLDQLLYHRVRSLELDIHKGKGADAPAGEWFVYHTDVITQDTTSCKFLSDCLGVLAAFHSALPQHEVVSVWVDFKDDFVTGHSAEQLDAAIVKGIGKDNILTPADLIAKCNGATTVRASVAAPCKFPSLASLRGKFMFMGTGGSKCDAASNVSHYGGTSPKDRLIFLAPDLNAGCALDKYDAHPDVVIFNMALADKANAAPAKMKGLVGRIYGGGLNGGLDSADDFAAAKTAGAVHLATDKVNYEQDVWSRTHGAKGFPFTCDGCDNLAEAGPMLSVSAASGDQWDAADSGFFAYETDEAEATWTSLVSVPSSHTEEFAKACLIARASEDAGAANVAFCRPFDNNPPRIQVRGVKGGTTTTDDAPTFPNLSTDTALFMRLALKPLDGGASTQVNALVSKDGKTFTSFKQAIVTGKLPLRGVSLSSHGSGKKHALFAGLTRAHGTTVEPMPLTKLTKKAIGANASGDAADGAVAP